MIYGICNQTFIPVRLKPKEQSEMSTQILFGEVYNVLEKFQNWFRIKNMFDDYEGWINSYLHTPINEVEYKKLSNLKTIVLSKPINLARRFKSDGEYWLLAGSTIYNLNGKTFSLDKEIFTFDNDPDIIDHINIRKRIIFLAYQFLNIPYLWGGRSTFGIDCSGFTQLIYKICNVKLKRDASQQISQGNAIDFNNKLIGDLAFFGPKEDKITHVGMIMDDKKIIHASGKVRIDLLDEQGIYNVHKKEYTHKLQCIRTLL